VIAVILNAIFSAVLMWQVSVFSATTEEKLNIVQKDSEGKEVSISLNTALSSIKGDTNYALQALQMVINEMVASGRLMIDEGGKIVIPPKGAVK
jgi:hypothetical protein